MSGMFSRRRMPGRAAEIRQWVAAWLGLGEHDLVSVAELTCHEAGCPPVETVVTIRPKGGVVRLVRIHKPLAVVTETDVSEALSPPD